MTRKCVTGECEGVNEVVDEGSWGADPRWKRAILDWYDAFFAREGFPDNAADETAGGLGGFPRTHGYRGETQTEAVDEAAAGVVVNEEFADQLLGAVGALRGWEDVFGYDVGEGSAVYGLAGCVDDSNAGGGVSELLEEETCAVDVDLETEVEVRL